MMRAPIALPDWTPPAVRDWVRIIESGAISPMTDEDHAILTRLASDDRMKKVWAELRRRKRPARDFLHPAMQASRGVQESPTETQERALGQVLFWAFSAVKNKRMTSKPEESDALKEQIFNTVMTISDVACKLPRYVSKHPVIAAETLPGIPQTIDALTRTAVFLMRITETIRGPDDLMTVAKSSGDPLAQGVQIDLSDLFNDHFGDHLHGTAATLTAVALGLTQPPDAAISRSRSVFTRAKQATKTESNAS
jgi:hypothetical protein